MRQKALALRNSSESAEGVRRKIFDGVGEGAEAVFPPPAPETVSGAGTDGGEAFSGAAEGSFYLIFSELDPTGLFWSMLVWRGICYYSYIGIGLLIYGWHAIRSLAENRKESQARRFAPFAPASKAAPLEPR